MWEWYVCTFNVQVLIFSFCAFATVKLTMLYIMFSATSTHNYCFSAKHSWNAANPLRATNIKPTNIEVHMYCTYGICLHTYTYVYTLCYLEYYLQGGWTFLALRGWLPSGWLLTLTLTLYKVTFAQLCSFMYMLVMSQQANHVIGNNRRNKKGTTTIHKN